MVQRGSALLCKYTYKIQMHTANNHNSKTQRSYRHGVIVTRNALKSKRCFADLCGAIAVDFFCSSQAQCANMQGRSLSSKILKKDRTMIIGKCGELCHFVVAPFFVCKRIATNVRERMLTPNISTTRRAPKFIRTYISRYSFVCELLQTTASTINFICTQTKKV